MTPKAEKKLRRRPGFDIADRHQSCMVDRGFMPAPKDATKLSVFFRFFRVFPLTSSMRNSVQRYSSDFQGLAVSCKNQENGAGMELSLHGLRKEGARQKGAVTRGRAPRAHGQDGVKTVGSVRQKGASQKGAATMRP